jgi:hypothetical protein
MTDQSDIPAPVASLLDIDLAAPSAMPPSVNILVTASGSTASSTGIVAGLTVTGTVHVYGAGGTSASAPRRPRRPQTIPRSMSDLDTLAWVTGRSIRNKELRVPLSDED